MAKEPIARPEVLSEAPRGRSFKPWCVDDIGDVEYFKKMFGAQREFNRMSSEMSKEDYMSRLGKQLVCYEVFAIYAENPDATIIFRPKAQFQVAWDEEEAKLRSGIYMVLAAARKEPTTEPLDPRYITIVCRAIAEVAKYKTEL